MALLCWAVGLQAQQEFHRIDWKGAAEGDSIPEVRVDLQLPDDYEWYEYEPVLEFPELVRAEAHWLKRLGDERMGMAEMPELKWEVAVAAKKARMLVEFCPLVCRDGEFFRVTSFAMNLKKRPFPQFALGRDDRNYAEHSLLAERRVVRVKVKETGVYRISAQELKGMGFEHPEKVRVYGYGGYLMPPLFANQPGDDLPQAPMERVGGDIVFFARGLVDWKLKEEVWDRVQNFYANEACYFLAEEGADEATAMPTERADVEAEQVVSEGDAFALYEKDAYSWSTTGRELYDEVNLGVSREASYRLELPGMTGGDAKVLVVMSSKAPVSRKLELWADGKRIGQKQLSVVGRSEKYRKAAEDRLVADWKGEKKESATLRLKYDGNDAARLNYLAVNYRRRLQLKGGALMFRAREQAGKRTKFVIDGADEHTVVWDVTRADKPVRLEGVLANGKLALGLPAGPMRELVAVNTASKDFGKVTPVGVVPNQDLHGMEAVDMVIITPEVWRSEAQRLADAHRASDSLRVAVVSAREVYNEFSSGTPDVTAYRRLMKMFYDRAERDEDRPRYLLLFGDCAYDNRMVSEEWRGRNPDDYLLCHQVENSVNETESYLCDDYIGMLDNREGEQLDKDLLDLGIGRFPVRTRGDAQAVVDKTIAYMNHSTGGEWKRSVCYMSDDSDGGSNADNVFMDQANRLAGIAERVYPQGVVKRLLPDVFKYESTATGGTYPEMKRLMFKYLKDGLLVLNYTGHSNTVSWSVENLLTLDDMTRLKSDHLAVWVTASCEFTRMDALNTSGGELMMVKPDGGAIALISATRVVYDSPNQTLNNDLTEHMYELDGGKGKRLGDIFRENKVRMASKSNFVNTNKMNFVLIGDPALRLGVPTHGVQVDEVTCAQDGGWNQFQAGGQVTVKGFVTQPDGTPATDFDGLLYPLVFDSKETVSTLDAKDSGVITYEEYSKVLFNSTDSVKQGAFELTFPVPLDIKYSNERGLMNLFARAHDGREACGVYDRFVVGGTSDQLSDDREGPKVWMYLNDPDFVWGGKVNETPYLVAELEDPDGINTVGNGIGHDLALIIDGRDTYPLNDYYRPQPGSYTKGRVEFSIPELAEGKHRLEFRSWDILNNSSSTVLECEVVKGLRPELLDVVATESPARTQTTFVLKHNRPMSEVEVQIHVYDYAGNTLWRHRAQTVPTDGYYRVDWDLTTSGGQRLGPGVYLYRAELSDGKSKESSQTRKIVLLAQ